LSWGFSKISLDLAMCVPDKIQIVPFE